MTPRRRTEEAEVLLGRLVWQIAKNGRAFVDRELRAYGLGSGQHRILRVLFQCGEMSQEAISRALGIDKAATTRAIRRLLDEGYVTRKADRRDQRRWRIGLTPKARRTDEALRAVLLMWQEILLEGLSPDETLAASALLAKIAANSERDTRRPEAQPVVPGARCRVFETTRALSSVRSSVRCTTSTRVRSRAWHPGPGCDGSRGL